MYASTIMPKCKLQQLSIKEKLEIIEQLENGEREKEMPKEAYEYLRIVRRVIIDLQHSSGKQLKIGCFFRPKKPTPPSTPSASPTPSHHQQPWNIFQIPIRNVSMEVRENIMY